uniref:Uncharacterized protein n=1 Tax=Vespula pensylvanica TaxID=30213 RepID=A0A834UE90_VESPE|nr:hypothetical protein H0235_002719 [Vespula pensylvanica]
MGASREVLEEPESKKKGGFLGSGESQEGTVRSRRVVPKVGNERGVHDRSSGHVNRTGLTAVRWRYSYDGNHVPVGGQSQDVEDEVVVALRCRKGGCVTAVLNASYAKRTKSLTYSLWTAKIQTDSKSDSNEIQELLADRNFIARLRARKIGPRSTRLAQKVREARRAEGRAFRNFSSRRCPLSYRVSTARRNFCPPGHVQPRNRE